MIKKIFRIVKQLTCKHNTVYDSRLETWGDGKLIDVEYWYDCSKCGKRITIKSNYLYPKELPNNYRCAKKLVKVGGIDE